MKNIKDMTLKTLLVMALMATPVFADGDMGGGGFANYDTAPTKAATCEGDMGGGGFRAAEEEVTFIDSLISEFFDLIG